MKGDVKPVAIASNVSTAVLFAGPTRLRGFIAQSTGSSGTAVINGLTNSTTVSPNTTTGVYIPISVGAGQVETLNLPEDGVLYAERNGNAIVDGIGIIGNTSALTITLFIDK